MRKSLPECLAPTEFTASDEVKQLLEQAATCWDHPAGAEHYIEQAQEIDHKREFGANTIFDILTHPVDGDD